MDSGALPSADGERVRHARHHAAAGRAKNRLRASGWAPGHRRSRWKWDPVIPAVTGGRCNVIKRDSVLLEIRTLKPVVPRVLILEKELNRVVLVRETCVAAIEVKDLRATSAKIRRRAQRRSGRPELSSHHVSANNDCIGRGAGLPNVPAFSRGRQREAA